jgi:hypothetical protein
MSITGNTVKAPRTGSCMRIDACRRVAVAGNVCYRAAQGYGVHVSGPTAEDVAISGNVMSENGAGGVFAGTAVSRIAVSGNSIRTDGAAPAITLPDSDSRTAANFTETPPIVPAARSLSVPRDIVLATVTGTATVSGLDPAAAEAGRALYLRFADRCQVTSGPNLVLASNFEAPANSVLSLACDGIKWYETARTVD